MIRAALEVHRSSFTLSSGAACHRLVSLDAFRGLTIAAMLLVNNPGSWQHVYAPLRHAAWDGCTPTDLVFPFFLFIAGVSMAISFRLRQDRGDTSRGTLGAKLVRRVVLLFAVGLFLHGFPRWNAATRSIVAYDLDTLRIPGVLPRIAWCCLIAGALALALRPAAQWIVMAGLTAAWLAFMYLLPVPGHGAGVLTLEGNAAGHIDRLAFGSQHLWLKNEGFDPEGLVSTLTATGNVFFGLVFGRILLAFRSHRGRVLRWLALAAALAGAGWLLAGHIPLNKQLWTPSFMLWTSGLAGLVLVVFYLMIDVRGRTRPVMPLVMFGMNAIVIYVASGVLARTLGFIRVGSGAAETSAAGWLWKHASALLPDAQLASLACALLHVLFFQIVAWLLWRPGWFIRL